MKHRLQKNSNFERRHSTHGNIPEANEDVEIILMSALNCIPFLECSLRCSLEAMERENCDSTGFKGRLKKSETACYEDAEKEIKSKRSR